MALDQMLKNGVVYCQGTVADIEADRAVSLIVVGRLYEDVSNNRWGRGISNGNTTDVTRTNIIRWEVTMTQVDAAVLVETNRATAAEAAELARALDAESGLNTQIGIVSTDLAVEIARATDAEGVLTTAISNEVTRAQTAEGVLTTNLNAEITRATAAEGALDTAYKAADAAALTATTAAIAAAVAAIRDTTVADIIPVTFTNGATPTLASILGANRPDGIYELVFTASDGIASTATVTGLPISLPDTGSVTYGDALRVVIDGGVVTAAVKIDDVTKEKFQSLDTTIADLQAATTQSAIRSHFSATNFATFANGVLDVSKSIDAGNDIKAGTDGKMYVSVSGAVTTYTTSKGVNTTVNVGDTFTDIYTALNSISSGLLQADNGLSIEAGKVGFGGEMRKNTTVTGAFTIDFQNTSIGAKNYVGQCYVADKNAAGYVIGKGAEVSGQKVEMWFDQDGDPKFTLLPNS